MTRTARIDGSQFPDDGPTVSGPEGAKGVNAPVVGDQPPGSGRGSSHGSPTPTQGQYADDELGRDLAAFDAHNDGRITECADG